MRAVETGSYDFRQIYSVGVEYRELSSATDRIVLDHLNQRQTINLQYYGNSYEAISPLLQDRAIAEYLTVNRVAGIHCLRYEATPLAHFPNPKAAARRDPHRSGRH